MMDAGWVELTTEGGASGVLLRAGGSWSVSDAGRLDQKLAKLRIPPQHSVIVDLGGVQRLDTAGAWLIYRTLKRLQSSEREVHLLGARVEHAEMLQEVAANDHPCEIAPPALPTPVRVVLHVGKSTVEVLKGARDFVSFFGESIVALLRILVQPRRLRMTPLVYQMEQVGFNALPIVGLISFLIGVVLAYQGAAQLQRLGAEVFVVDLVAVSILREIGILLTAIVIAGRSGSAFTAQIGSMKANEEVDALRTLGLDPIEVLVIPRVLALVLTLPMLAFVADILGLVGGGLMAWVSLDISPAQFLERLRESITMSTFWVGIIKAPVFAMVIALVGCHEGLKVSGSAESVGTHTTRAVVQSIFLVIVFDAVFSIFFAIVGL